MKMKFGRKPNWKKLSKSFSFPLAVTAFGLSILSGILEDNEQEERFKAIEDRVGIDYEHDD